MGFKRLLLDSILLFIALTLIHEAGHLIMGLLLGYTVKGFGLIYIEWCGSQSLWRRILLHMAGFLSTTVFSIYLMRFNIVYAGLFFIASFLISTADFLTVWWLLH